MSTPEYRCHVTGREVLPLSVGDIQTVAGKRFAWFRCPCCDRNERRRSDAGFDAANAGVHVVWLDRVPAPREWRSRWLGKGMPV